MFLTWEILCSFASFSPLLFLSTICPVSNTRAPATQLSVSLFRCSDSSNADDELTTPCGTHFDPFAALFFVVVCGDRYVARLSLLRYTGISALPQPIVRCFSYIQTALSLHIFTRSPLLCILFDLQPKSEHLFHSLP